MNCQIIQNLNEINQLLDLGIDGIIFKEFKEI